MAQQNSATAEIQSQTLPPETVDVLKRYATDFFAYLENVPTDELLYQLNAIDKIGEDLTLNLFRMRHANTQTDTNSFQSFEVLNRLNKMVNTLTKTNQRKTFRWIKNRTQRKIAAKYVKFETTYKEAYSKIVTSRDELKRENILLSLVKDDKVQLFDKTNEYIAFVEILKEAYTVVENNFTVEQQQEILFTLNSKHQELLTRSLVVAQSYQASVITIYNNTLLLKKVDDALSVTLVALRTAKQLKKTINDDKMRLLDVNRILDAVNVTELENASSAKTTAIEKKDLTQIQTAINVDRKAMAERAYKRRQETFEKNDVNRIAKKIIAENEAKKAQAQAYKARVDFELEMETFKAARLNESLHRRNLL